MVFYCRAIQRSEIDPKVENNQATIVPALNLAVPVPALRAEPAAQARPLIMPVPALALWIRAWAVLFRVRPARAHHAWPIWPYISLKPKATHRPRMHGSNKVS